MKQKVKKKNSQPKRNGLTGETLTIDVTPKFYYDMKLHYMKQIPRMLKPFVRQYFNWLVKLDAGDVMDWMESTETLKEIYSHRTFAERAAIAGARGFLRAAPRLRRRAAEAINLEVACFTLRFENPMVWEVIKAYHEQGMARLKEAIEDVKEIMKLTEATD